MGWGGMGGAVRPCYQSSIAGRRSRRRLVEKFTPGIVHANNGRRTVDKVSAHLRTYNTCKLALPDLPLCCGGRADSTIFACLRFPVEAPAPVLCLPTCLPITSETN